MAITASTIRLSLRAPPVAILAIMTSKIPKSSELRELIGRRLKAARIAYQPNAASVARALDLSPQTLNKYEQGTRFPDELFLVRFNELTSCPTDWIFLGRITAEMPAVMAARIAVQAPDLVSEPPMEHRPAARERGVA
jgi:transcriptional regulator with XRE-family HTH domain